jgi:signal transduction histidine kinase
MKFNIRTRLTFQFTYIVSVILIFFSFIIYYFSADYREFEFYSRLKLKAVNTAQLLIVVKEVDYNLMKIIDKNSINAFSNQRVLIFDFKDSIVYNSSDGNYLEISKNQLNKVRQLKEVRFHDGKKDAIGFLFTNNNDQYIVITSAVDNYGIKKLNNLKWIILIGFLISIGLTVYSGRIYANRALKPMSDVVQQVDKITISNLDMRVAEGNGTDEIAQLAITFNKMLERLESAFEMQRSFVSNASHELRTPLTSITGQLEVSLLKPRTQKEYFAILESVLEDIKNLNALSNGLLDLAKASSDVSSIALRDLRIDEILWKARAELLDEGKAYKISIKFSESVEDEQELTVLGNEHLLKTAITNLMDNGCKFSPNKSVEVTLTIEGKFVVVSFIDNGIGINDSEIENIFHPFYRAKNATNISGNGLGLSLTDKIIKLHKGVISIESQINKGTKVRIAIPFI